MNLPWRVIGVILAAPSTYYEQQQAELSHAFVSSFGELKLTFEAEDFASATEASAGQIVAVACASLLQSHRKTYEEAFQVKHKSQSHLDHYLRTQRSI